MECDAPPREREGRELLLGILKTGAAAGDIENRNCCWVRFGDVPTSGRYSVSYFDATPDCTIAWKSFSPSAEPSRLSLERSGWGIIPSTLRPSLQMPAMLSSEPLGLDSAVTSPSREQ